MDAIDNRLTNDEVNSNPDTGLTSSLTVHEAGIAAAELTSNTVASGYDEDTAEKISQWYGDSGAFICQSCHILHDQETCNTKHCCICDTTLAKVWTAGNNCPQCRMVVWDCKHPVCTCAERAVAQETNHALSLDSNLSYWALRARLKTVKICERCAVDRTCPCTKAADSKDCAYCINQDMVRTRGCQCSSDLTDCTNCYEAYESKSCHDCIRLSTSENLRSCVNCEGCKNCVDCKCCEDCVDCINCAKCDNSVDCLNCQDCSECTGLKDVKRGDYSVNCHNCEEISDSENLIFCKECEECKDCTNSTKCKKCDRCTNCVDCVGCEDCVDCVGCVDCEDCVGCVGLRGIKGGMNLIVDLQS